MNIHNYDRKTYCAEIGREAWGCIKYQQSLAPEQTASYNLIFEILEDV